ncbi:upstream activation factor subunit spp27-like [Malania oleifera]|uniref:upstream activation factor subunit spp27-like n=1 Tax=Malania oleifera TaxID=397392 RepID=UPI0025ADAEE7|nr:upstream activation factor subunit spp27-like [Malania oleifera]
MSFVGKATGRVFEGCRVLLAAAKGGTSRSSSAATTTPAAKRPSPSAKSSPSKSSSSSRNSNVGSGPKRPTGITKAWPVSPALCDFLGVAEASRTDAVKKIWDYIKLHSLQSPTNKRVIHCDEKLKTIFAGKEEVSFLEIGKLLSAHFVKT